ncbi:hypothetical protein D3C80_1760230 [compost metagenome]
MQLSGKTGIVDGNAYRPFAENHAGCGVQAIEEQAAGGRVRAVAAGVIAEHRMHRADSQGISAAFGRAAGQGLQGLGIAEAAVTWAAQTVELGAQAPNTWILLACGIDHAPAA